MSGLNQLRTFLTRDLKMVGEKLLQADEVLRPVTGLIDGRPDARILLALSGGMDSVSLLHMLATVQRTNPFKLVALHADHGLQSDSKLWAEHCERLCGALGVDFESTQLNLVDASENTARTARYDWFRKKVRYGDVVLTAHHQQDRAETVLFNLLRGSGSAGLSSLRFERPFYGARLMRPLLNTTKVDILNYAKQHGLSWVEDPSNQDTGYARNHIRKILLPALASFRADAIRNIARAASNLEQENSLLREIAIADLAEVREKPRHAIDRSHALCVDDISELSPARQTNLIRFWLSSLQLHMPSKALTEQLVQGIHYPPASTAVLQEEGCQFRFYRGYLYVMPATPAQPVFQPMEWQNLEHPIDLHESRVKIGATQKLRQFYSSCNQGTLRLEPRDALNNPKAVQGHSINLKKWLQDAGVPPWRRHSLPILTLRQSKRDVVLAPIDQGVENEWVDLSQEVA